MYFQIQIQISPTEEFSGSSQRARVLLTFLQLVLLQFNFVSGGCLKNCQPRRLWMASIKPCSVQFNSDLLANPVERPSEEYALQKKLAGLLHSGTFRTTARSGVASFVGGCGGNWVKFVPPKLFRKGPEASLLPPFLPLGGGWGKGKTKKKRKKKKPRWTLGRAGTLTPVFDCSKKNFLLLNVANVLFTILFSRQCLIKVNN